MLEKIGRHEFRFVSAPDSVVIDHMKTFLTSENSGPVYYEIGVGVGSTAYTVAKMMNNRGEIFLFSYEDDVRELASDLRRLGFTNVNDQYGSPRKTFSGYHFQLAMAFLGGALKPFDLAYIDGGHVLHLDAPAACVLKEVCKVGGLMVFDDWSWSMANSPTVGPKVNERTAQLYDDDQIRMCHVQMVCRIVMDTDRRFDFLGVEKDSAIYRRVK